MRRVRASVGATVAAIVLIGLMVTTPLPNYVVSGIETGEHALLAILPAFTDTFTSAKDLGPLPATQLTVGVALIAPNEAAADSYVYQMYTPGSPLYGHHFTASEWEQLFSPSASAYSAVENYYGAYGLTILTSPNRLMVGLEGSSDVIASAFHTDFHSYGLTDGQVVYGPATPTYVPSDLSIAAVTGMTNATGPKPQDSSPAQVTEELSRYLAPATNATPQNWTCKSGSTACDLEGYYSEYPLLGKGDTGSGITVGIVDAYDSAETQSQLASALKSYASNGGLPTPKENFLYPIPHTANLNSSSSSGWGGETELDEEMVDTTAPGATIDVAFASDSSFAVYETVDWLVANNISQVITMSWGEPDVGTMVQAPQNPCLAYYSCNASWDGSYAFLHPVFAEAVAEGITPFSAAGDCGASDGTAGLSTDYPSSDPFVIGSGGTLPNGTGSTYAGETGWSGIGTNCTSNSGGGGGGYAPWAQPWWQYGPGQLTKGLRGVPDVSADADDGTSQASPMWAGWMAVADQIHGGGLGLVGPSLYAILRNSTAYAADFHNVKTGNNGYSAGKDWNPVTGLGSPIASSLLPAIAGYRPTYHGGLNVSLKVTPQSGLTYTLSATASGGLAPYSYDFVPGLYLGEWTSSSSLSYTYASNGVYEAMVTVYDKNGNSSTSLPVLVNPGGKALVVTLNASATAVTVGTQVNFTTGSSGGTSPYYYTYFYGNGIYQYNATATNHYTYHSAGTFCPSVFVYDSAATVDGGTAAAPCITVSQGVMPFTVGSLTASPSSLTVGTKLYLNVSASGGTAPYIYSYTGLPTGCTSANVSSLGCTPTGAGNFTVSATVTDSASHSATRSTNVTVSAGVTPPTITAFTATPNPVIVNQTTSLSANASGGTKPYSFVYSGLPSGCSTMNSSTLSCTPDVLGISTITVTLTDAKGKVATKVLDLNVTNSPVPVISSFTSTPSVITLGNSSTFSSSVSGGFSPYTYSYTGLPSGCVSSNAPTLLCTPNASGSFTTTLSVSDSHGNKAQKTSSLTVNKPSTGGPTVNSFIADPNPVTVGSSTTLNVSASGGTQPYSYAYTGLPGGCVTGNTPSLACTPTSAGTYTIKVSLTDAAGKSSNGSLSLEVKPSSTSGLEVTAFTVTPTTIDLGGNVSFQTVAQGGTEPYSYAYSGLPSGCTSQNTSSFTCAPTMTGSYDLTVTVTDAKGSTAGGSAQLTVNPAIPPAPQITAFTITPANATLGNQVNISSSVSGGSLPLSYSYEGLPQGCASTSSSFSCTPGASGTYTVTLTVRDSMGRTAERSTTLVVTGSTSSSSTFLGLSTNYWILVAVAAAAIVVVAVVLTRRPKKGPETGPYPAQPQQYPSWDESNPAYYSDAGHPAGPYDLPPAPPPPP